MRKVLILVFSFLYFSGLQAQKKDTLDYFVKPFGFYGYSVNKKEVPKKEFYYTYSKDATTTDDFNAGKLNTIIGTIMTYTGGFMLGWQLGDMLFKKSNGYQKAYVGAGLLGLGYTIAWTGQRKSTKALVSFNASDQILGSVEPIKKVDEVNDFKSEFQYRVKNACYIVRVPVSATKIKYYEEKLQDRRLPQDVKQRHEKELSETLEENKAYVNVLQNSFTSHFSLGHVYFLPDSSFKSFTAGQKTGFINNAGTMDKSITCPHDENFFLIAGKHKEQLVFLDQNLHKLDTPFPYKKNMFLPTFKLVLNRKGYIDTQVKYMDSKLNPILTVR